jgi:hypothetical protein
MQQTALKEIQVVNKSTLTETQKASKILAINEKLKKDIDVLKK